MGPETTLRLVVVVAEAGSTVIYPTTHSYPTGRYNSRCVRRIWTTEDHQVAVDLRLPFNNCRSVRRRPHRRCHRCLVGLDRRLDGGLRLIPLLKLLFPVADCRSRYRRAHSSSSNSSGNCLGISRQVAFYRYVTRPVIRVRWSLPDRRLGSKPATSMRRR